MILCLFLQGFYRFGSLVSLFGPNSSEYDKSFWIAGFDFRPLPDCFSGDNACGRTGAKK